MESIDGMGHRLYLFWDIDLKRQRALN